MKQIEEVISQRERQLADFVDNAAVGLHWVGADGKILWANQAELDLLGYTREEYIGHHIAEFHVDRDVIDDILQRLTAGETLLNCEARLRAKNGAIKQVLINSSVRFENDQFVHTRCFTVDITERKEVEERIVLLYQLTAALSEAMTPQQVADVIMEQGIDTLGASAGSIVVFDKEKANLEILVAVGYSQQITEVWQRFPVHSPIVLAESVRTEQAIWLRSFEELRARFPAMGPFYDDGEYNAWAAIPLIVDRRVLGALGLSFKTPQNFDDHDRRFMMALAQQCAQALERARLSDEARDLAVLEERQRLARDLHDSVSQTLFSINTLAQTLPRMWERDEARALTQVQHLITITQAAMAEMRTLLLELRPTRLVQASLSELFTQLAQSVHARSPITLSANVELEQTLPEDVHIVLYRIAQESINNMVKHGQATEGSITLKAENGHVILRIHDNGSGFDTSASSPGLGLGVMRERAAAIGATLKIISQPGTGTEVIVKWQLPI